MACASTVQLINLTVDNPTMIVTDYIKNDKTFVFLQAFPSKKQIN